MVVELPMCRWRRQPTAPGHHVCVSPRIRCNAHGIPDSICGQCKHRDHPADPGPRLPCVHFGPLLRVAPVKLLNRTDGAAILTRYHQCAVYGECSPNTVNTELACCMTCPSHCSDWHRPGAGAVRHLTYFIYPAGPWWQWNVDQLRRRLSLFNGRRLVAIATDAGSASAEEVEQLLAGQDIQFRRYPNDPARKEMVAHLDLISDLQAYRGEGDATFYGHGKGSGSHPYGEGVRLWAEEMYRGCLDYWPAVQRQLVDHAAVGVFRRIMSPAPAAHVPWHYSGSFRWVRNRDLYARAWQAIDPNFYGVETYPGRHFTLPESACLYGEFAYGGVGLYLKETWDHWASSSAEDWRTAHQEDERRPQLLTCILPSHAQPELVHQAVGSVLRQTTDAWQLVVLDSGPLADAGHFARYAGDARIALVHCGSQTRPHQVRNDQAWKINEAWRRGLVRGDLVCVLADDDLYDPAAFALWIKWAATHPEDQCWYGLALRGRLHQGGFFEGLGLMPSSEFRGPEHGLRGHVDGMQACVRRAAWLPWSEDPGLAREVDGYWLDTLAATHGIAPARILVGTHRHTPGSRFTQ